MFAHLRVTRGNGSIFQFKVYGSASYPRQYCNIYGRVVKTATAGLPMEYLAIATLAISTLLKIQKENWGAR